MKEFSRMKLWMACFDKPLFRKELEKIVSSTSRHEMFDVLEYCYNKYSDMHADVLLEVFTNFKKSSSNELTAHAEGYEPIEKWNQ